MGTRGFLGFVVDGVEKITYNHSDSYPEGLGADTLTWLSAASKDLETLRAQASAMRVVTRDEEPTQDDVDRLAPWTNLSVGERSTDSWYCLLRETQGNPAAMLRAGYIEDASDFPVDSLFAEWGYVVDLDANTFEVYQGFQKQAHDKGRFASRRFDRERETTYYPVALLASWPLDSLPTTEDFYSAVDPDRDKED